MHFYPLKIAGSVGSKHKVLRDDANAPAYQVGGHDEGGVLADDGLAAAVGQPALVEQLQQDGQHVCEANG